MMCVVYGSAWIECEPHQHLLIKLFKAGEVSLEIGKAQGKRRESAGTVLLLLSCCINKDNELVRAAANTAPLPVAAITSNAHSKLPLLIKLCSQKMKISLSRHYSSSSSSSSQPAPGDNCTGGSPFVRMTTGSAVCSSSIRSTRQ